MLVAGNVPATLQIAARSLCVRSQIKDGNPSALRGASPYQRLWKPNWQDKARSTHHKRNTDFQVCAPNRHSWLFAHTAIQQAESPLGAQASMPMFRPPRLGETTVEPTEIVRYAAECRRFDHAIKAAAAGDGR